MEKTAFVFAGGGSLGAIEAGMLRELIASGVQPDFLVGASAGAINSVFFAFQPHVAGTMRLEYLWRGIRRQQIMPWSALSILSAFRSRGSHLVSSAKLRELLSEHYGSRTLEDADLPVYVVATEMKTGNEVVLSSGSAVDAVLASTAIPGVFPPVSLGGNMLIDGGVANNTPISTAIRLGATRVIVLTTGFTCAERRQPKGALEHAMSALNLLVARQLVSDLERWASHAAIAVVAPLCPLDVSPYDYSQCGQLIDRAATETRRWLEAGGLNSKEIPAALKPHTH
ncbi:patatin-like phospholipase family protein [Collimonas arenae]|uniref:Patatin-like phospholipase family protein n=1 Tax=Collimonas arenae TaxID=279058 RepID=A0A127PVJ3_9BURK|nr:patatin-like phospholipase family protein [Collimonas arenae]AMP01625.1 patatin-like phospholipase family protein [Collimonas arenae]AMP11521.1 patatin-like phospholipase family protein [Collimonas arenae]